MSPGRFGTQRGKSRWQRRDIDGAGGSTDCRVGVRVALGEFGLPGAASYRLVPGSAFMGPTTGVAREFG